jgi:hypothetical protein
MIKFMTTDGLHLRFLTSDMWKHAADMNQLLLYRSSVCAQADKLAVFYRNHIILKTY